MVVHGGIGKVEDIIYLKKNIDIEGINLASILHYNLLNLNNESDIIGEGNIEYLKNRNMKLKNIKPIDIKNLKKILRNNQIDCRINDKYIAIIDYKINNLFSISNILNNIGLKNIITNDKKLIDNSYAIILPGVGSFPNAMENLDKLGLIEIIKENAVNDKIIIGYVWGFNFYLVKAAEIQGSEGLNILSGEVKDLTHEKTDKVIPHVGWNQVFLSRSNCEKFS